MQGMNNNIFIAADEAMRRYGKADLRTLKRWARNGDLQYQVLSAGKRKQIWLFESPEARYARTMGQSIN